MIEKSPIEWIKASWPTPSNVCAGTTIRKKGYSIGPYAHFNLSHHTGDIPKAVAANRKQLESALGLKQPPCWLKQVHGNLLVEARSTYSQPPTADGSYTQLPYAVSAVLTADCLPLLLCDTTGTFVAALHGGWRSLAGGIIAKAITQAATFNIRPQNILVWLGPAIGPEIFQVGGEVRQAFINTLPSLAEAFQPDGRTRYTTNLYEIARQQCKALGVTEIYGGQYCTYSDSARFYSYRRDGQTGRMASIIWLTR